MINNSKPGNLLILAFIISFLINNPWHIPNGPTIDMYHCIKYNLNNITIKPFENYHISTIKIPITIGDSQSNSKIVDIFYFPNNIEYIIQEKKHPYKDTFKYDITDNNIVFTRTDENIGWGQNLQIDICIKSNENIYLFNEICGNNGLVSCHVVDQNNIKVLDSRTPDYFYNRGW